MMWLHNAGIKFYKSRRGCELTENNKVNRKEKLKVWVVKPMNFTTPTFMKRLMDWDCSGKFSLGKHANCHKMT